MNRIKYSNIILRRWWWLLPLVWIAVSCSKNEEPPKQVGQTVPYNGGAVKTLSQLLDSVPDLTIYDSIYHHSGLGHMLDSLRSAAQGGVYTLFAPSDLAFQKAGITLAQVAGYAPSDLDSLVFYLTVSGSYTTQGISGQTGYAPINTLLQVSSIASSLGSTGYPNNGYSSYSPYTYLLTEGWTNGLMLNGMSAAASGTQGLQATDGILWELDTLIRKPTQETYALIANDTNYTFYLAACQISDSVYQSNYIGFPLLNYTYAPDTLSMQMQQGFGPRTFFVPTNAAFRKAGFQSVADIDAFIQNSYVVISGNFYNQYYNVIPTNMDSILNFHQTVGAFYTQDMLYNTTLNRYAESPSGSGQNNEQPTYLYLTFTDVNGQVVLHRQDFPGGRAATITGPHDMTTLNGVVHSVDNLLLPQP